MGLFFPLLLFFVVLDRFFFLLLFIVWFGLLLSRESRFFGVYLLISCFVRFFFFLGGLVFFLFVCFVLFCFVFGATDHIANSQYALDFLTFFIDACSQ